MNSANRNLVDDKYVKKSFPVLCGNGKYRDARTGSRLNQNTDGTMSMCKCNTSVEPTEKAYYSAVWDYEGNALVYRVYYAKAIGNNGLIWKKIYEAYAEPYKTELRQRGVGTLQYWFSAEVQRAITPGLVYKEFGKITPKRCASRLWKMENTENIPDNWTMEEFFMAWLSGEFQKKFVDRNNLRAQKFGIEIEFTGMTRAKAAKLIADFFYTRAVYAGGDYKEYHVTDSENRKWKIVRDGSVAPQRGNSWDELDDCKCELVSPLCEYDTIPIIQEMVRILRKNGMKVNNSCGIHVHVDAGEYTVQSLKNLVNIMASREALLFKALKVRPQGVAHFCKRVDQKFLTEINKVRPAQAEVGDICGIWYEGNTMRKMKHYDVSRYHALNLHSLWQGKGIEFRMFNSTTHAGVVKTYIQLSLAISNQAKVQKRALSKPRDATSDKAQFKSWITQLGLTGDEFETARYHLLKNLEDTGSVRIAA